MTTTSSRVPVGARFTLLPAGPTTALQIGGWPSTALGGGLDVRCETWLPADEKTRASARLHTGPAAIACTADLSSKLRMRSPLGPGLRYSRGGRARRLSEGGVVRDVPVRRKASYPSLATRPAA